MPFARSLHSLFHRLLFRAQVDKQPDQLAHLIHDDFKGVEPDGSIISKQEAIDILSNHEFTSGELSEDAVIHLNDLTIVIGVATFQSAGPESRFRFTDVITNGKLIVSHTTQLS